MKYIVYEVTKTELIKIDKVKATNSDIAIKKALIGTTRDPKKKYFAINYQSGGVQDYYLSMLLVGTRAGWCSWLLQCPEI